MLFIFLSGFVNSFAQGNRGQVAKRVKQVENGLFGWVRPDTNTFWRLADRMNYYHVNAVSIAVIRNYKVEWVKAYGWADVAEHRAATTNTVFQACSMSKSFNGLGALKLVEQKKLALDTDINAFLKTWQFPYDSVSKGKKITLRQLLTHYAGLNVDNFPGYPSSGAVPDIYQVLDGKSPANTVAIRSFAEPGKQFAYSGGGPLIAELMIMDASGLPYDVYMQDNVLRPLGMDHSTFSQPPPHGLKPSLATAYQHGKEVPGKYFIYPEQAAAGLWTTPGDLSKYIIDSQLGLEGKPGKVLSPAMTKERLSPVPGSPAFSPPGMGAFIHHMGSRNYFSHSAENEGFSGFYIASMSGGDGLVIMMNSNYHYHFLFEIVRSVARVYHWGKLTPLPCEVRKTVTLRHPELVQGTYVNGQDTIRILEKGRQLFYSGPQMAEDHPEKVLFTSAGHFLVYEEGPPFEGKLQKDKAGRLTGLRITLDNKSRLFKKQPINLNSK